MSILTPRLNDLENRNLKNYFINGAFEFWQRGQGDISIDTTAKFLADRFINSTSSNGVVVRRVSDSALGIGSAIEYDCSASTLIQFTHLLSQRVESVLSQDLQNKTVIISGYFKSSVGGQVGLQTRIIIPDSLNNYTSFTTILQNNTLNIDANGAWQHFSFEIDLSSINVQNGIGFVIDTQSSDIGTGSFRFSNMMLFIKEDIDTDDISGIKFQRASRNYQEELQLCQRYFEKNYPIDVAPGTGGFANSGEFHTYTNGTIVSPGVPFKVLKRVTPIITLYRPSNGDSGAVDDWNENSKAVSVIGRNVWCISYIIVTSAPSTGFQIMFTADAEL